MSQLTRVQGPECPACGCEDSDVIGTVTRWGQSTVRRRCKHCSITWTVPVKSPAARASRREGSTQQEQLVASVFRELKRVIAKQIKAPADPDK